MKIDVSQVSVEEITPLRELYRQEMNCQIMLDSFPRRGFSDPYLLHVEGRVAAYGLVANQHWPEAVHEFYVIPSYQGAAQPLFRQLLEASQAKRIVTRTNDPLLLLMLYDCATDITTNTILFEDAFTTHLTCPAGTLEKVTEADKERLQAQKLDADSGWMIVSEGIPVATGGALFHYNPPYGDIFMEVHEAYRQRGYGSYLVQELKRLTYEMGKRPAARCNATNVASRRTMEKAGLLPCARLLEGDVLK